MKRNVLQRWLCILMLCLVYSLKTNAQCPAGFRDTLNWDYLDFLRASGAYISPTAFITLAQSQTQRFTFGTQRVTITHTYTASTNGGDTSVNTAETGSYGKGDDIRFRGDGTVTFTFQNAVQNVKFSIYDIDNKQKIDISAFNGAASVNTIATALAGGTVNINNNNTSTVNIKGGNGDVANTDNAPLPNGTVNIDIAGPVTSFTLAVSGTGTDAGEDGSYYISDVSACSVGTFPMDYYNISKPFVGQPAYFLAVMDNTIYYVNVNNGVARKLFKDAGFTNINSLAYDPYRHMVYYTYSLTSSSVTDKTVRRYDYDLDTLGIFIPNVNTLGIPTFESGVESGAAAFFNGSYYMGIEGTNQGDNKTNRESIVWKIDLTPAYAATGPVSQVYAVPTDDGAGNGLHDWGDIGINDGILYDFDGAAGQPDFYQKNMLDGSCVNFKPSPVGLIPRQVSVDWVGQMYNSGSPGSIAAGTVAPYNNNGTINTAQQYTMKYQGVAITGSWGDAGEAFKPKTDFGDAPASYDPAGSDPGTHEKNDSIRLGNTLPGIEWVKKTSSDATGDGPEEDGVTGLQVISTGLSNFTVPVKAYNNTGRNATVAGWVDANGNGIFDPSEGTSITIPSSSSMQNVTLLWSGILTTVPAYSTTFMRIRIATVDQGMTTAKPTGYFDNGEIEDYQISVSIVLAEQHVSIKTQKINFEKVNITWSLNQELNNAAYELQRSDNGISWQTITNRSTPGGSTPATYSYRDNEPFTPLSYYRVKVVKNSTAVEYSDVKKVDFTETVSISLSPNPAKNTTVLKIQSAAPGIASVNILDYTGRSAYEANVQVIKGINEFDLPVVRKLSNGMYKVRVKINEEVLVTTLAVMK